MTVAELDDVYVRSPLRPLPTGRFDGKTICRFDNPGAVHPVFRPLEWLGFEALRWGIDFDVPRWFWWGATPISRSTLEAGRFDPRPGRSRWRETEAVGLFYEPSRLPRFVRDTLYDEVKPLTDDLALGIGGVSRDKGQGDHFYFLLTRPT
jgi:hypothetical protein